MPTTKTTQEVHRMIGVVMAGPAFAVKQSGG